MKFQLKLCMLVEMLKIEIHIFFNNITTVDNFKCDKGIPVAVCLGCVMDIGSELKIGSPDFQF